ncbi:hypothetical protein HMPREF9141_0638 [Prevotella multiformis DSM 16608]|uniref:Uncharacterized protein n=1 Tax=Prevotella multiformis DSM 16608 TaxID=888743 RepID=F0F4X2_9BACT|nr:hypothetical protein HMPREF9141_0638 [Prevotella multiformis DSM 16608]
MEDREEKEKQLSFCINSLPCLFIETITGNKAVDKIESGK